MELLHRLRNRGDLRGARGTAAERSLVWMLGSPRTGSTWLLNLLTVHERIVPFDEPGIGYHLGLFVADVLGAQPTSFDEAHALLPARRAHDRQYFFSTEYERVWLPRLRALILDRMQAQLRDWAREKHVDDPIAMIKEPAGSQVAEFIFHVLPASRLLFLIRDPRDVLDSHLDAIDAGSWMANRFGAAATLSPRERLDFLAGQAHRWLTRTEVIERAYERLPDDQRYRVRYEDLRSDTVNSLRGIVRWLGLDVADARLHDIAKLLSFDALPEDARGKGKFTRAATPGTWRENLTAEEQAFVNDTLGDTLGRYGYEVGAPKG